MSVVPVIGAAGPAVVWYLARASGLTALVLLTLTMVGGIVASIRWSSPRWPRFVTQLTHRNVSLLAIVMIGVHIATVVVDGFAPIGWKDAVVPFTSGYRPFWVGLGAIGFDLLLAIIATSLLRHRIGPRTWRLVHWSSYVLWPVLVVHGLASGSDTKAGVVLATNVACVGVVVLAVWWRLANGWSEHVRIRVAALAASVVVPTLLTVWLVMGPLASGWARTAGTPDRLLASPASSSVPSATTPTTPAASDQLPSPPFSARVSGTLTESATDASGLVTLQLSTRLTGGATGVLDIALQGQPTQQGGVRMSASRVQLGSESQPATYDGEVTSLNGNVIVASLRDSSGAVLDVTVSVQIDRQNRVTGSFRADAGTAARTGA